jgi:hypothetical protein
MTLKLIKLNKLKPPTLSTSYFKKAKSGNIAVATLSHALHTSTVIERWVTTYVKPSRSSITIIWYYVLLGYDTKNKRTILYLGLTGYSV